MKSYIQKTVCIRERKIWVDQNEVFHNESPCSADLFLKSVYQYLAPNYPKFHKMDGLSKLAFLAAEMLLENNDEKNIALIFSNKESSLDTDRKHQQAIQDPESFFPSPATFVYTLPNIAMGEVAIRHQLKTENIFLLGQSFQTNYIYSYSNYLLDHKLAKSVLCGWLKFIDNTYEAVCYLVGETGEGEHSLEIVNELVRNKCKS